MPHRSKHAAKALAHLPEADPALAALALWCRIEDSEEATRTKGSRILVGREFADLHLREQIGWIGHHILHVALQHASRMENMRSRMSTRFDPQTYNLAADAVVNEVLLQAGHALPRPTPVLSDLLTEVLKKPTDRALRDWDVDGLYIALTSQDVDGKERQSDYQRRSALRRDLDPGSEPGNAEEVANWQGHLARAAQRAGPSGRGIGPLLDHVSDRPLTSTPWEVHLRRYLATALSDVPRLTYRRPSRDWIAAEAQARQANGPSPAFQPGHSRSNMRMRIVIGVDSSESISKDCLALFDAEVNGAAKRTGAEVHALYFDENVYRHEKLSHGVAERARGPVRRGGGTAFADLIEKAAGLDPSVLVILTDLDGHFGPKPQFPVVWATMRNPRVSPPFGRVLTLDH